MAFTLTQDQIAQFKDAFIQFAKDGTGTIKTKELGTVMHSLGVMPTKTELEKIIHSVDPSGTGTVTFEQFAATVGAKDVHLRVLVFRTHRKLQRITFTLISPSPFIAFVFKIARLIIFDA